MTAPFDMQDFADGLTGNPESEAFAINSEDRLSWYIDKRASYAEKRARIERQAAAMIAEIDRDETRLIDLYGVQAEGTLRDLLSLEKRKNARSKKFLTGTIDFRSTPEGVKITNKDALIEAIGVLVPELGKLIKPSIDTAEFKRYVTVAGGKVYLKDGGTEVELAGLESTPATEKSYITFAKAEEEDDGGF